jgi:hypothetical protein
MTVSFVWIMGLKGVTPQKWDDDVKPHDQQAFLKKVSISEEEAKLPLDELAEKYPRIDKKKEAPKEPTLPFMEP